MKVIDMVEELSKPKELTKTDMALMVIESEKKLEEQKAISQKQKKMISRVIHSDNSYTASEVAKDLDPAVSGKLLNEILVDADVIFKNGSGLYELKSKYLGFGLTRIKESKPDANERTYKQMKWSLSGKNWVHKNFRTALQRVSKSVLLKYQEYITKDIPSIPMPNKKDRNFD